jgi:hypothetical protein
MDGGERHSKEFLATVLVLTILGSLMAGTAPLRMPPRGEPELLFDDSVDASFQALAQQTWDRFLAVFQARSHCFGDVHLRAVYTLDSRAGYDPVTATVTVQVPGTPAKLQSALVHEWAHHVEFQCREHRTLRAAFLVAEGLPPETPWRPASTVAITSASEWAAIPSEQYAEATVELVLGDRALSAPADFSLDAVRVVEAWAAGK